MVVKFATLNTGVRIEVQPGQSDFDIARSTLTAMLNDPTSIVEIDIEDHE